MKEVTLASSDLTKSLQFWKELLELNVVSESDTELVLNYDPQTQANLRLVSTQGAAVDHAAAFGRIAFSIPTKDLPGLETKVKEAQLGTVKTPLVVLPTPGKADVQVIILEDPVIQTDFYRAPLLISLTFRTPMKFALSAKKDLTTYLRSTLWVTSFWKRRCRPTKARSGTKRRSCPKKRHTEFASCFYTFFIE